MFAVGCHLSVSKGYKYMGEEAIRLGASTFQFFTRNPRGGKAKELDLDDFAGLLGIMEAEQIPVILAHAPYTMNLCSKNEATRMLGRRMMAEDLERMEHLPGNMYNLHPGSHTGQGIQKGMEEITEALNEVMWPEMQTMVLLETMAGKGSEVGSSFEELRAIINGVKIKDRIGVCLDTCHIHDAGYDIVHNLEGVLEEFDRVVGLERLKAVHLNDSKNSCGSHKDRHEKLGEGIIGKTALKSIVTHPELRELPFYLETPNDAAGYMLEIEMVKAWQKRNLEEDA